MAQQDKEQKKLLSEIMQADEKDGLYGPATKMETTQTAVEWLEEKLKENLKHIIINNDYVLMESYFLQAKQMEKEQIINAWKKGDGVYDNTATKLSEKYYNETYGKDKPNTEKS